MKKQVFLTMLVLLCFLSSVAWTGAQKEAETAEGPITINMWVLAENTSDWWHLIKQLYEKNHPDVTLNLIIQQFDNLYETTYPALASKAEEVDLIWTIGGMRTDKFGREGLVVDLAPYFEKYGWYDKQYPAVQLYRTPGGGVYNFSTDWIVSPVYYYNRTIFKEVGVEPPKELNDIFTLGDKFKAAGYIPWAMGSKHPSRLNKIITNLFGRFMTSEEAAKMLMWERDPNKSKATAQALKDPGVYEAYNFINKMNEIGMFPRGAISMDEGSARRLFTEGKAAMHNTGTWGVGLISQEAPDLDFWHFILPEHNGNTAMLTGFPNSLTVPIYISERKLEVVVDILDSLTKREYGILSYDASLMSTSMSITSADIKEVANPMVASIVEAVSKNGSIETFDQWASPERNKAFNHANAALISGEMTVDEVVQYFYDAAVDVLE